MSYMFQHALTAARVAEHLAEHLVRSKDATFWRWQLEHAAAVPVPRCLCSSHNPSLASVNGLDKVPIPNQDTR